MTDLFFASLHEGFIKVFKTTLDANSPSAAKTGGFGERKMFTTF